jgi:hypothetical protein
VPGERVEQLDVLLGAVDPFPGVLADPDYLEQPALFYSGPIVLELSRPGPGRAVRQPLADLVVDVLDLAEEGITSVGEHVFLRPQGQVPTGPQRRPGPLEADGRVHPVPRRSGEHQAGRLLRPPVLEPPLDHLDVEPGQVPAGRRGELGAQFHAGDAESPPGQRQRSLARGAPDLQQPIPGLQPGQRNKIVVQRFGIVGPDSVVDLGRLVKRLPQPLALSIGSHRGQYRDPPAPQPAPSQRPHLTAIS